MKAEMSDTRYAIVTGAASGLGRAIAVRLAQDGWHIAVADVNETGSEETGRMVTEAGSTAQVETLDVRDEQQWVSLRERLRADWPRLDLIVNNAGVVVSGAVGQTPIEDWDWLLSINLRGVILGCHTMVDWLKENPRRSHVMNMASVAGLIAPARMGAYNVAKAGVVSLSETLYQELKRENVGVTVVCPWFVKTNLLETGRFADTREKTAGAAFMENSWLTAEKVADKAVRGMYRGKLHVVVGFRANQFSSCKRHFPGIYFALSEWTQRRILEPIWSRGTK
ncbi:MAG: SDR family NAD(P)-dependent oxidoreductase [Planctomycetota bacterium]|nr:MAG: SDR family NAD(P)-dependent oxidoreductase [Planctomycetota bacterium]